VATIELASGVVIHVNPDDPRGQTLIDVGGNLNPKSAELWNQVLGQRQWASVIDVGVNYGEMLTWAKVPKGAKVYGFEPNPAIIQWLKQTIATLPFGVNLIEAAVSNKPRGTVEFQIDAEWSGTSKLAIVASHKDNTDQTIDHSRFTTVSVPCVSIDSELANELKGGFAMKVDVEGHEVAAIRGARRAMRRAEAWAVMFEIMHMRTRELFLVALRYKLFLYDQEAGVLVRAPRFNGRKLIAMRLDKRFYRQDAVLLSSSKVLRAAGRGQPSSGVNRAPQPRP
jgi:FkbM family methyltransferase